MFSCEFCEIFNNTFFYRALPVTASDKFYPQFSPTGKNLARLREILALTYRQDIHITPSCLAFLSLLRKLGFSFHNFFLNELIPGYFYSPFVYFAVLKKLICRVNQQRFLLFRNFAAASSVCHTAASSATITRSILEIAARPANIYLLVQSNNRNIGKWFKVNNIKPRMTSMVSI